LLPGLDSSNFAKKYRVPSQVLPAAADESGSRASGDHRSLRQK
jgi:hypothetical protein